MERTNERKQFLADIFTTALEGGIDYWAAASEYHWQKDGKSDLDQRVNTLPRYATHGRMYALLYREFIHWQPCEILTI